MYALYGKLPATGDFVSRGFPREALDALDEWLASGLISLQHSAGDWLQGYLIAPVWQFVVPAGRLCAPALAGALMPSCDRVGRYFPLLVARTALPADVESPQRLCDELCAVAGTLPAALQEGLDADALLDRIDGTLTRSALPAALGLQSGARLLEPFRLDGALSLWWSLPGPTAPFRYLSHRGRSDADLLVSLFGNR